MVQLVGEDQAIGQKPRNRRDRCLVRHEARGKDQTGFLVVKVGQFVFQLDERMIVAGDIARAAGTGAHAARRIVHGSDNRGMLAHSQIIVRAPYGDFTCGIGSTPKRARKSPHDPFQIGKDPIALFSVQLVDRVFEKPTIVHELLLYPGLSSFFAG